MLTPEKQRVVTFDPTLDTERQGWIAEKWVSFRVRALMDSKAGRNPRIRDLVRASWTSLKGFQTLI